MNDREVDHVTILAITGEQYTFEDVESVKYDEEKEAFMVKQSDGTLNLLPRENMVIFADVPKQATDSTDNNEDASEDVKIFSILDGPTHRT